MSSNWWLTLLSYAELAGMICVCGALIWKRQVGRWPSLFAAIILEFTTNVALLAFIHLHTPYRTYFYAYWVSQGVQELLRLWIIADIMRSFPGVEILPAKLYLFIGVAGATMAFASGYYCWHLHYPLTRTIQETAFLLDRCVAIAWVTFSIVFLSAIKILHLGWSPIGARIANGVFLRLAAGLIIAEGINQHVKQIRLLANGLDSVFTIAVFFFWVYTIVATPTDFVQEELSPEPHQRIDALLAHLKQRRTNENV